MNRTLNSLDEATRSKSAALLETALIQALDLERQAKQAHWNVKGSNFTELHHLFDAVAQEAEDDSDLLAERMVALGGVADGRVDVVAARSTLPSYPIAIHAGVEHLKALAKSIAAFGSVARESIDQAAGWGDADTADIFTEISRNLDKCLWQVEAHLEPDQDNA